MARYLDSHIVSKIVSYITSVDERLAFIAITRLNVPFEDTTHLRPGDLAKFGQREGFLFAGLLESKLLMHWFSAGNKAKYLEFDFGELQRSIIKHKSKNITNTTHRPYSSDLDVFNEECLANNFMYVINYMNARGNLIVFNPRKILQCKDASIVWKLLHENEYVLARCFREKFAGDITISEPIGKLLIDYVAKFPNDLLQSQLKGAYRYSDAIVNLVLDSGIRINPFIERWLGQSASKVSFNTFQKLITSKYYKESVNETTTQLVNLAVKEAAEIIRHIGSLRNKSSDKLLLVCDKLQVMIKLGANTQLLIQLRPSLQAAMKAQLEPFRANITFPPTCPATREFRCKCGTVLKTPSALAIYKHSLSKSHRDGKTNSD
jgi:hypothetical protein